MIALPDVNVLLALVWSNHPNHVAAHEWFSREAASGWATCTLTQSGFLRLSLNPQVVQVTIDGPTAFSLLNGLVAHTTHQHIDHIPALSGPVFEEIFEMISGTDNFPMPCCSTLLERTQHNLLRLIRL